MCNRIRNYNTGKARAAFESVESDTGYSCWNIDAGEACAVLESTSPYRFELTGEMHACDAAAPSESRISDAFEGGGQRGGRKTGAAVENIVSRMRDSFRDVDVDEIDAVLEGPVPYMGNRIRQ